MRLKGKQREALRLTKELALLATDDSAAQSAINRLRERFRLAPMTTVLEKVPGPTVVAKATSIGISRQTYYGWLKGRARPNEKQAKRLEELTGVPMKEILFNIGA